MKRLALLFLFGAVLTGCGEDPVESSESTNQAKEEAVEATTVEKADNKEKVAVKEKHDNLTNEQKNALRSAESYIAMTGYSRNGLIKQLSSEYGDKYSVEDATMAVDSLDVDWSIQAERSAKSYLEMMGHSRDGLIQQLSSDYGDGYSKEEATAAVDAMDVDWNEQAVRSAKSYLDTQGFSCDGLIHQLSADVGDRYTKEQAEYGAKQAGACD